MTQDEDQMASMISESFDYVFMLKNIRESNEIENILREPYDSEVEEHKRFLELPALTVEDVQRFVYVYAGAGERLRNLITDHHYIGKRKLEGGPHVKAKLNALIRAINEKRIDPWNAHVEYELLHPFTDGNGRSGRMIWHWMMKRQYNNTYESMVGIGFLRRFYYQAMQYRNGFVK